MSALCDASGAGDGGPAARLCRSAAARGAGGGQERRATAAHGGADAADGSKDLVKLLYTSGSTGLPKGAMYTDAIWRQVSADSRKVLSTYIVSLGTSSEPVRGMKACAGHHNGRASPLLLLPLWRVLQRKEAHAAAANR